MALGGLSLSTCWGKNLICQAQEDQEQSKRLPDTRRTVSSATTEIHSPGLDAVLIRGVPRSYHRSLVSLAVRWRKTTQTQRLRRSLTTWPAQAVLTRLRGTYTEFDAMLSAMATDSKKLVQPDSEIKLLCVKCGLRTKSCTHSRTPCTSPFLMTNRSRFIINFSPRVAGPRVTSAVNWNT